MSSPFFSDQLCQPSIADGSSLAIMPIPLIAEGLFGGLSNIPYAYTVLKALPWLALLYFLKVYFGGARNTSERLMHSKIVMITVSQIRLLDP